MATILSRPQRDTYINTDVTKYMERKSWRWEDASFWIPIILIIFLLAGYPGA